MRQTGLLKTIPLSFYSAHLYREVGKEWSGMGFVYLLLVVTLSMLLAIVPPVLIAAVNAPTITLTAPFDFEYMISQMPTLTVKGGELSVAGTEQHYYIRPKNNTGPGIIIDTTHEVSEWNTKDFTGAVLGKTQFLIKSDSRDKDEAKLYHYPPDMNQTVTREDIHTFLEKCLPWVWPAVVLLGLFAIPMVVLIFFVYRILQMLLFGVFGLGIAALAKVKLDYTTIVRLASVASTPLLALELAATPFSIDISWWLAFGIAMLYLFFAIKANADT